MFTKTAPADVWSHNIVLVQLLSLSPLLAISQSAIKGLSIAIFTSIVAVLAVTTTRLLHNAIRPSLHFIWMLFLVASITTVLELAFQLTFMPLYRELGIYVPLASCNLALLIHLEQQYQLGGRASYRLLLSRSALMAIGLILALGVFSGIRELLIFGTIFRDLDLLTTNAGIPVDAALNSQSNQVFSFGLLQPGAFILLALLIAAKRWLDQHLIKPGSVYSQPIEKVSRARVTGKL
jgi:electron transport complex protein RnfE